MSLFTNAYMYKHARKILDYKNDIHYEMEWNLNKHLFHRIYTWYYTLYVQPNIANHYT